MDNDHSKRNNFPSQLAEHMPIAALCHLNWVCWRAVPQADGKTKKLPISPITGGANRNNNPSDWGSFQQACDYLAANPDLTGLGFVLTPESGMFFVDIDDALHDGKWNDITNELIARLPGAFVEVSQSGRGVHIIGTGTPPPGRRCKSAAGFDIYPGEGGNRFVALTGTQATGSDSTPLQAELNAIFDDYLGERASAQVDLTDGPREDWSGPEDDAELLKMAMRSASMRSRFGAGVTFKQLWECDEDALGAAYPHDQGTEPFDHSRADAALLQHLAFWTGCDAERMDRLFRQSGLMRDKWDERPDYIERSMSAAIAQQGDVYRDRAKRTQEAKQRTEAEMLRATVPAAPVAPAVTVAESKVRTCGGTAIYGHQSQEELFRGCVYVSSHHGVLMPNGEILAPERFNAMMPGGEYDLSQGKTTRKPFEAFTGSHFVDFPKADRLAFRPERPQREITKENGLAFVNAFVPAPGARAQGDVMPFLRHLELLLPDSKDREILLSWCAAVVQKPGVKAKWAPVLIGTQGNGKSLIGDVLAYAVGRNHTVKPRADQLGGRFNSWIENKLLAVIEEIHTQGRREVMDALKPLITEERIEVEGKGRDALMVDNRCNMLMCSNHRDAIMKTRDDRRYAVFYCAQQSAEDKMRDGMDDLYFKGLFTWLEECGGFAAVAHFLDQYVPSVSIRGCSPHTSGTEQAIEESRSPAQQAVLEAVDMEQDGFTGGMITAEALKVLLDGHGIKVSTRTQGKLLDELGYRKHPMLPDGKIWMLGRTVRVYSKRGHPVEQLQDVRAQIERQQQAMFKAKFAQA